MFVDILKLRKWYASPMGRAVAGVLSAKIKPWAVETPAKGRVLALGYGLPYENIWPKETQTTFAMPTQMGVVHHFSAQGKNKTCMVWEGELPFPDVTFDAIFLNHVIEFSGETEKMLEECWRVLRPDGQLILTAANRSGAWCRREISPFARGRPYSTGQVFHALQNAGFAISYSTTAVFMPPSRNRFILKYAHKFEKYLSPLGAPIGGVVVVRAGKDLACGSAVRATAKLPRRWLPMPSPAASVKR